MIKNIIILLLMLCFRLQAQQDGMLKNQLPYPLGAALNPQKLATEEKYRSIAKQEFNSITAENHMKMMYTQPRPHEFDFQKAETLMEFAKANGQRVHGHTLVWHNQTPAWLSSLGEDASVWENELKNHIQTLVKQFKGRVMAWDVVNEAFLDDGSLRPSPWAKHVPDYLAKSFLWAREADPEALLFYNDYGQEGKPKKMQAILDMVEAFKKRGVPIDGIGLQMHTNILVKNEDLTEAIQKAKSTGLMVHISELDVAVNPKNDPLFQYNETHQLAQLEKFELIFKAYNQIPKAQQYGITFWNVGDKDSWLRSYFKRPKEYPLLFDEAYEKKPVYQRLLGLIKNR